MSEGCGQKIGPYDCCTIITGDAKELAKAIPDESVDLIFTDPPYPREFLPLWPWLGQIAARALRSSGFLMTYCPSAHFEYVFDTLRESLEFYWPAVVLEPGMNLQYHPKHVICGHKAVLLFRREQTGALTARYFPDGLSSSFRDKRHHPWGQSELPARLWVDYVSPEQGMVLDPFCGGGTTPAVCKQLRHHYLAFEIDPDVAERARERVRNTQPPLFVMQPEQEAFL